MILLARDTTVFTSSMRSGPRRKTDGLERGSVGRR
jgi:hypothetical protein